MKYLDTACTYPDDKWVLGSYLGPEPDVGSMMTSKILRHTGDHIPRSNLLPLKDWEITDPDQIEQRHKFDRLVHDALGKPAVETDFPWEFLTPINESHEDNDDVLEGSADFEPLPDPEPLPTPEASDNYVNANVMLPLGDSVLRGHTCTRTRSEERPSAGTRYLH